MGCYVNPNTKSKEDWLREFEITPVQDCEITKVMVPVCLINNGPFSAAAVAYKQAEMAAFMEEDGRQKIWFMVPRTRLYEVSDLKNWE